MHIQIKVSIVYHIAAKMKREMTYTKAIQIAERFSESELNRILKAVK